MYDSSIATVNANIVLIVCGHHKQHSESLFELWRFQGSNIFMRVCKWVGSSSKPVWTSRYASKSPNPYQWQSFLNVHHHLQVSLSKHTAVCSQSVEVQTCNVNSLRPIFSLSTLANWKIGQKASVGSDAAPFLLSLGRITRRRRVTARLPRQDEGPVMTGNRRTPPRICLGVVGWAEIKSRTNRFVRPSPLFLAGSFPWETITVERPWSWVLRVAGTRTEVHAYGGTQLHFDYFNRSTVVVSYAEFKMSCVYQHVF